MTEKFKYIEPDINLNKLRKNNFFKTIDKINNFTKEGLGVSFIELLEKFISMYGENLIINANQIVVPSIDQCVRNLFANKLSSSFSYYKPVSLSYKLDSFKKNNPEKLTYIYSVEFGNNKINANFFLDKNQVDNIEDKSFDQIKSQDVSLYDYWKNKIKDYKGFNVNYPDLSVYWDKITRIILEEKKKRINKGNNNLLIDLKINYNGQNYFCSFSKKKNAYSTKKIPELGDYTSIDDLLKNKNIKLALPAKLYYPYVYLPLATFMRNFIIDYELDTTGLLDTKLVKKFFDIVGGNLGLIDLGSFYKGTFIETEYFKEIIISLLGDLAKGIEDLNWLSLSSMISSDVYNKVFNGLEEIKLTTPKQTAKDITNAIGEELKSIL